MRQAPAKPRSTAVFLTFFLLIPALFSSLRAETGSIDLADDLRQTALEAKQRRVPIMLVFSQYHCEFCDLMKQEVLHPMQLSGDYKDQVVMREVMIDAGEMVTNFQGKREEAASFADRYGIFVTPTLLFLDGEGKEAAKRILGINTVDYLLFYIEEAIEKSSHQMN